MEKKYLIVTESCNKAINFAKVLGEENSRKTIHGRDFFIFFKTFNEGRVKIYMTSVQGHFKKYEFHTDYYYWSSCNPLKLFTNFREKIYKAPRKKEIEAALKKYYYVHGIIIWTDDDREGDNIGRDILDLFQKDSDIVKYRARCSEITKDAFTTAFTNKVRLNKAGGPPLTKLEEQQLQKFKNAADAVDVRMTIDLLIGAAFSRLLWQRFPQIFPNKSETHSMKYGSCILPLLGYVVNRTKNTETTKKRPVPLNTAEMLKNISKFLEISIEDASEISQDLYHKGYISYPRTSTNCNFSKEHPHDSFLKQIENVEKWKLDVKNIRQGLNPEKGKTTGAHPPIHPIKYDEKLWHSNKVYRYIVDHYLASIYKDVETDQAGKSDSIQYNYLRVYDYKVVDDPPPGYIHEADLIDFMVKNEIGTSSTYAEHIKNLKSHDYVERNKEKPRFLRATPLAIGLAEGFESMDLGKSLITPELRSEFQKDLMSICENVKNANKVLEEYSKKYRDIYENVRKNIARLDDALAKNLKCDPKPVLMKCSGCGSDIVFDQEKPTRTKCTLYQYCQKKTIKFSNAKEVSALPKYCEDCGQEARMVEIQLKGEDDKLTSYTTCIKCCEKDEEGNVIINQTTNSTPSENEDNTNGQNAGDRENDDRVDQSEGSSGPVKKKPKLN